MNNATIISNEYGTLFSNKFSISIENPANLGKATPPLYISQSQDMPEHPNKLLILITNISAEPIIIPKKIPERFNPFKIIIDGLINYDNKSENSKNVDSDIWSLGFDFSDLVYNSDLADMTFKVKGEESKFEAELVDKLDGYPGKIWTIRYKNIEEDYLIEPGEVIEILIENIKVFQRPGLRYVDFYFRDGYSKETLDLIQYSVLLKRPANYVTPPFPLLSYWLGGVNSVYISENQGDVDKDLTFENELRFAISNIGKFPLQLDCRMDIRESPYFELVVLGEGNHSNPGFLMKKEGIKDIQLEIDNDNYGNIWSPQKKIQGPVVTWRIQPVREGMIMSDRTIIGVEEKGTISFTLKGIETTGEPGVSMVYLRYYNIPDYDDGQLVLFVQKKKAKGNVPSAAIWYDTEKNENSNFHPPMSWEIVPSKEGAYTSVTIGHSNGTSKIRGKEISLEGKVKEVITKKLHVQKGNSGFAPNFSKTYAVFEHGGVYEYVGLICKEGMENGFVFSQSGKTNVEDAGIYYNCLDGTGNGLQFRVGGNKKTLTIASTQNIGICTTKPKEKIEIKDPLPVISFHNPDVSCFKMGVDDKVFRILSMNGKNGYERSFKNNTSSGLAIDKNSDVYIYGNLTVSNAKILQAEIKKGIFDNPYIKKGNRYLHLDDYLDRFNPFKFSDQKLKQNIIPISSQLDVKAILAKLNPVSYQWNNENPYGHEFSEDELEKIQFGLIADEVEKVVPELVQRKSENEPLRLNYQEVNTILLQAVKDQQSQIETLTSEFNNLKNENQELKDMMNELNQKLNQILNKHPLESNVE